MTNCALDHLDIYCEALDDEILPTASFDSVHAALAVVLTAVRADSPRDENGVELERPDLLTREEVERFLSTEAAYQRLLLARVGQPFTGEGEPSWALVEQTLLGKPELEDAMWDWHETTEHLEKNPYREV